MRPIDADALKNYMAEKYVMYDHTFDDIDAQPTIEPKRGEWINDGKAYALYKCSACNEVCPAVGYAECIPEERMYKLFKFCPNCGVKMERSEE